MIACCRATGVPLISPAPAAAAAAACQAVISQQQDLCTLQVRISI
jgi:hypothetical protein